MSSPFTTAFLTAWRQLAPTDNSKRITLAKIELSVPSALTLRFATTEVNIPDPAPLGTTWQAGLEGPIVIRSSVEWLGAGMAPSDTAIRLAKRRDASQTSGTLQDLLSKYVWQNAIVTLYLWTPSLTSFSDAAQIFRGKVSSPVQIDPSGMTLNLLQDQVWNFQLPPTVDLVNYPSSPDVSQGLPIAIVYGDHSAPPMKTPWPSAYGSRSQQEDSGAGRGVVPLVLVDAGVGAASVKLVAAGHSCSEILDRTVGDSAFIAGDQILNPLDTGGITKTIGSTESYLSIADENAIAYAAVVPIDVRASANTAGNPRRAMDENDETTYATLDQAAGKGLLQLIIPNPPQLGYIESVDVLVAYSGDPANANNMRVDAFNPGVGAGGTGPATWAATSATPAIQRAAWSTNYWNQNWQFGSGGAHAWDIRVDFVGGAGNKARIYWVVLVVKYRPQRSVVTPGSLSVNRIPGSSNSFTTAAERASHFQVVRVEPTFRLDGQFFANVKGYKDDGSGTFTGTASALIERPCDIIRHFLVTYGLISGSDIETGAGATGSFVDARSLLRNAGPSDVKLAAWIGEKSTVQQIVQKMAEQSGMAVYFDRLSSKWLAFVWRPGAAEDYGYKLSWYDMTTEPSAEESSVVETRRAIRVLYAFDHFKSKTLFEAFVNPTASGQGFNLPTVRDQRLAITTGVNDKLDFNEAGVRVVTLSAGTYVPIDLASEIQTKMRALGGAAADDTIGFGFSIKTGFNDLFDFSVGGTNYLATLSAGDYTAEGFCIELPRALNAVAGHGLTFSCAYSHPANKFTLSASGNFRVNVSTNTTSAVSVFGMTLGHSPLAASSLTADVQRFGDRIWSLSSTTINFLWASGANAATNCADLVGFKRLDTGFVSNVTASYSRGDRERVAATYDGYYDPREERQIAADWVRDEETAVQLRNRIFDLTARPRVKIRLSSHRIPDIRPMQVIELLGDLDSRVAYAKYGTDGSWVGKPLRVLEVEQHAGPDYPTEIMAVEA